MRYPEIFDYSDKNKWRETYLRKELRSKEWDLMIQEPIDDVLEVPFFTDEFCDKFVENLKDMEFTPIDKWGTDVEVVHPEDIEFFGIMKDLIDEFGVEIGGYKWHLHGDNWNDMDVNSHINKLEVGQQIRLHHDFVSLTQLIMLEDNGETMGVVFPKYDSGVEPKKGYLYLFPGQITHRYGIRMVKETPKYFITNYCLG